MTDPDLDSLLRDLHAAAVAAAAPGPALATALHRLAPTDAPVQLIAAGKAAIAMAAAAVMHLREAGRPLAGGVVVAPEADATVDRALRFVTGDHPVPGARSLAAAEALAGAVAEVRDGDEVWVLLSGGASSLIAAPLPGVTPAELARVHTVLLGSGLDIGAVNRVRKRFTRWGAGRLARALAPARVRVYAVSDVIGDDPATIGSGPCSPDPTTAGELRELLTRAGLWNELPVGPRSVIDAAERDAGAETPKPGDPCFDGIELQVVASNAVATAGAARAAVARGFVVRLMAPPIAGEAREMGERVARVLVAEAAEHEAAQRDPGNDAGPGLVLVWGGEPTVTLPVDATGAGGRAQELALAAARVLADRRPACRIALLAAGTDGRDGPTDAAGAVVDAGTWGAITAIGRDPARDLADHDSYRALDAAGALLRTGLTGTNVMDVVIGAIAQAGGTRGVSRPTDAAAAPA